MGRLQLRIGRPATIHSRRLYRSPTDALINLVFGGRLCCQAPVRLDLRPIILLRLAAVLPQRWPACRGYMWVLGLHPDVLEDLLDLRALGDKGNQAHLPTALRAQQRENFVDTGYQHRPQVVRWVLGWDGVALRHHPKCSLARAGGLGLRRSRLGQRRDRTAHLRIRCQHTKIAVLCFDFAPRSNHSLLK